MKNSLLKMIVLPLLFTGIVYSSQLGFPVEAQGGDASTAVNYTGRSIPTSATEGKTFTASATFTFNHPEYGEDTQYSPLYCTLGSYESPVPRSGNTFPFTVVSTSMSKPSGGSVKLSVTSQSAIEVDFSSTSSVVLSSGQKTKLTTTLKPNMNLLDVGDSASLQIYCMFQGVNVREANSEDSGNVSIKIKAATTTTTPVVPAAAPVASAVIPAAFTKAGNTTTSLAGLTTSTAAAVSNFTLDSVDYGKVVFTSPVNLSGADLPAKFNMLDSYVVFSAGKISIDSSVLAVLNVPATVTFTGLNLSGNTIVILHNGVDSSTDSSVSNVLYDSTLNTLTFSVTGFSEYTVAPNLSVEIDAGEEYTSKNDTVQLTGSITDKSSVISVTQNDNPVEIPLEQLVIADDGTFAFDLVLVEGENIIKVSAQNDVSPAETIEFRVNFTLEKTAIESAIDSLSGFSLAEKIVTGLGLAIVLALGGVVAVLVVAKRKKRMAAKPAQA